NWPPRKQARRWIGATTCSVRNTPGVRKQGCYHQRMRAFLKAAARQLACGAHRCDRVFASSDQTRLAQTEGVGPGKDRETFLIEFRMLPAQCRDGPLGHRFSCRLAGRFRQGLLELLVEREDPVAQLRGRRLPEYRR